MKRKIADNVLVHTTDERTVQGILALVARDGLVLRAAKYLDEQDVPLGGELFVPRERVLFVQVAGSKN